MREIHECKWNQLQPLWDDLYNSNTTLTPFQSYAFLTFTGRGKPYRKDLFRLMGVREWNLVLYRDGTPVVIAPLLVKKLRGKYRVTMRGHYTVANQLDFIYKSISYEDTKFILDYINSKLAKVSFLFDRVSEKTAVCEHLKSYFAPEHCSQEECYAIPVAAEYDEWIKSLSRSARGNLSTYYNRLEKDNQQWRVEAYSNQSISQTLTRRLMKIYADRFLSKNGFHMGAFRKCVSWLLHLYLMRDKMTQWLDRGEGNYHAILHIGPEIAAFASGLICRDKRIIVSRLAISPTCYRYGPGGVLISSILKHLIAQNQSGDMDIMELDLSQGGQGGMSYKQTYGGQVHYCYVFHN